MFCPKCGAEQSGEPNYCGKCGQRLKPPEPAAGQDGVFITQTQNIPPNNAKGTPATKTKNRHGCLTAYLILMLVSFAFTILIYVAQASILKSMSRVPAWRSAADLGSSLLGIICVIALFRWKRWGFWGYCILAAAGLTINILAHSNIFLTIIGSVAGVAGIVILFGVLNIGGKDDKGWPQLE